MLLTAASTIEMNEVSPNAMSELLADPGTGSLPLGPDPGAVAIAERPKSYKRPYRKSISGCKSCKARKIKCDEQRPVCANCKRRFMNVTCCEYNLDVSKPAKRLSVGSRSSKSSPPTPPGPENQVSFKPFELNESNRILELRLLHHYTKTTCAGDTLGAMVPILCHPMWEINIPKIAFASPIVLDALLGISALHLLALKPDDHSLALAARSYFNKAVTKQKEALTYLSSENAEPLLVTAVLIAHHTWLATHIIEQPSERYNMTLQTYRMCLGIQVLIRRASPWLEKYTFTQEVLKSGLDDQTQNEGFMKLALEDLASISVHFHDEGVPPEDSHAYNTAASEVSKIYSLLMAQPLNGSEGEQAIVTILHRMPARYLELLEAEDPLAMTIMARNLSLLTFLEDSPAWWIHGAGAQKVSTRAVLGIKRLMPTEWLWTMTFPMNIISKEIKLNPIR